MDLSDIRLRFSEAKFAGFGLSDDPLQDLAECGGEGQRIFLVRHFVCFKTLGDFLGFPL